MDEIGCLPRPAGHFLQTYLVGDASLGGETDSFWEQRGDSRLDALDVGPSGATEQPRAAQQADDNCVADTPLAECLVHPFEGVIHGFLKILTQDPAEEHAVLPLQVEQYVTRRAWTAASCPNSDVFIGED